MYHIYTLSDPQTQEVRYVGLSRNAHKRFAMHLINPGKQNPQKNQWVQTLLEAGTAPILSIIETPATRKEAEERETHWIQYYLKLHGNLLNLSKNRSITPPNAKRRISLGQMEDDLRSLLKEHGWNLFTRVRGEQEYYYAQKWREGERYIVAKKQLPNITKEKVLSKIQAA